jgi:hypothetical protein
MLLAFSVHSHDTLPVLAHKIWPPSSRKTDNFLMSRAAHNATIHLQVADTNIYIHISQSSRVSRSVGV